MDGGHPKEDRLCYGVGAGPRLMIWLAMMEACTSHVISVHIVHDKHYNTVWVDIESFSETPSYLHRSEYAESLNALLDCLRFQLTGETETQGRYACFCQHLKQMEASVMAMF